MQVLPSHLEQAFAHHVPPFGRTLHCYWLRGRPGQPQLEDRQGRQPRAHPQLLQLTLLDGSHYHGTFCSSGRQQLFVDIAAVCLHFAGFPVSRGFLQLPAVAVLRICHSLVQSCLGAHPLDLWDLDLCYGRGHSLHWPYREGILHSQVLDYVIMSCTCMPAPINHTLL